MLKFNYKSKKKQTYQKTKETPFVISLKDEIKLFAIMHIFCCFKKTIKKQNSSEHFPEKDRKELDLQQLIKVYENANESIQHDMSLEKLLGRVEKLSELVQKMYNH